MSDEAAIKMARRIVRDGVYGPAATMVARALLSREAERDAVIEKCAKAADEWADRADRLLSGPESDTAHQASTAIAAQILSLKTAGEP